MYRSRESLAKEAKEAGIIFPETYSAQGIQQLLDGDAEAIQAAAECVRQWQDIRDNGPVIYEWNAASRCMYTRRYAE